MLKLARRHPLASAVLSSARAALILSLALPTWANSICPNLSDLPASALFGIWTVRWSHQNDALLVLEPNANHPDSLGGLLRRGSTRHQVAGDLEDGQLTLEESKDGIRIWAVFEGQVNLEEKAGRCEKTINGTWKKDEQASSQAFEMRWQSR